MPLLTAEFLREHRDDIIRTWESVVSAHRPRVKLERTVLRPHLPALLDGLAAWQEQAAAVAAGPQPLRAAEGQPPLARIGSAHELPQLLREFRALRETILLVLLAGEAPADPASRGTTEGFVELTRLNAALDSAITDLVERFVWERDRAVAELTPYRRRYTELFDTSPDAIFVSRGGKVVLANDACARLFGAAARAELAGRTAAELFHPDDHAAVLRRIAEVLRGARPAASEVRIVRLDGAVRDVEVIAAAFADVEDDVGVQVILRDVTDRKLERDALRTSEARLREFLLVLSHELRNPLAPIRNAIYLLERAPPGSEPAGRAREVLRRQTDHLTRLVGDLLDVTRISRGKITLQQTRLDLRDVVRKTTDDERSLFDDAGISLRVDQPAGPVWVDGDATRLAQALANLLQNAAKFTPAGGLVCVRVAAEEGRATVSVKDSGVGIEPDQVERMFEPFAQGAQGLARTKGGLGLGLALVRGLAEQHGGTATARSEGPGRGAEFVIALPLADAPPAAAPAEPAAPRAPERRLVLVVEDSADSAQTLADILILAGHEVRIARDGRTGLALARELRPDVILCDIGLPDLDGYEVARALRGDPALAGTRLVALTGYAQPEDRELAREAGFDAHLPKPPPLEELERLLEALPAGG